jgi:hypothetical protein
MSYYDDYMKMFPTPEALDAAIGKTPGDAYDDDISTAGCHPFAVFLRLRNEAIRASLLNPKATQMATPKASSETPPNASIAHHQPVAAPPAPRRHATTRQRAHA